MTKLRNISDIRRYFHRNKTPIYFISATNFNLLGISEWVRNFRYINYIDCFDGRHPMVRILAERCRDLPQMGVAIDLGKHVWNTWHAGTISDAYSFNLVVHAVAQL